MIINGDCLEVMRGMADASVTAIVTDPPYALNFMGKGWDKVLPPVDVWREALRVLKPGGMLLAFGGTRTSHRLTCSIEDAGFQIRDSIMWLYGSGFPKSQDISKAMDKAAGAEREVGPIDPDRAGRLVNQSSDYKTDAGWSAGNRKVTIDPPSTDAAKKWAGYGTALKPAHEPIVMAMKPIEGTYVANALEHGVAGINVDGCRVPTASGDYEHPGSKKMGRAAINSWNAAEVGNEKPNQSPPDAAGRWPANIVHDGSDEVMDQFPDAAGQQGDLKETGRDRPGHGRFGEMGPPAAHKARQDESKSASRFFYCAKASKKDRGEGNAHPTVKPTELMRWLVRMVKMPTGTIILDPFAGSGSTGVACALEGIDFVGIEIDEGYADMARSRMEKKEQQ